MSVVELCADRALLTSLGTLSTFCSLHRNSWCCRYSTSYQELCHA